MPGVGETTARLLALRLGSVTRLMKADEKGLREAGVGPLTASDIHVFLQQKHNRDVIAALLASGVTPAAPRQAGSQLAGKTFVLPGTLPSMTRAEAAARLLELGARVSDRVTGKTDYLVAGQRPGSKADAARALHIAAIDEQQFLRLLGQVGSERRRAS
jgi:DNA ligase (NAD+)